MTVEARVKNLEGRVGRLETDRDSHSDKLDHILRVMVDFHNEMRRYEEQLPDLIARAVVDAQRDLRREMVDRFEKADTRFEKIDKRFKEVDQQLVQVNENIQKTAASVLDLRQDLPDLIARAIARPRHGTED